MKWFLILLAFALGCFCLTGLSSAADMPPPLDTDVPVMLAACTGASCPVALQRGQPLRNVGRVALQPLRRLAAVRPLRRIGSAIREVQPLRRVGRLAIAPIRWLRR